MAVDRVAFDVKSGFGKWIDQPWLAIIHASMIGLTISCQKNKKRRLPGACRRKWPSLGGSCAQEAILAVLGLLGVSHRKIEEHGRQGTSVATH